MILADDKSVAIPTATKTGTFSLESALSKHGYTRTLPRHSSYIPVEWHDARVMLMIRNPYDRLASMYTWGIKHKHSWLCSIAASGFSGFCRAWAWARESGTPHDWVTLLSEYADAANATNGVVEIHRLEDNGVQGLASQLGLTIPDKNINQSSHVVERPGWTRFALDAVDGLLDEDLRLGGYRKPDVSST